MKGNIERISPEGFYAIFEGWEREASSLYSRDLKSIKPSPNPSNAPSFSKIGHLKKEIEQLKSVFKQAHVTCITCENPLHRNYILVSSADA